MEIFDPYEIEIKTGRTKEELVKRFKRRAEIKEDRFFIHTEPYNLIPASTVVGDIRETIEGTLVSFKISASVFLRGFTYLWLGGVGITFVIFVINALRDLAYHPGIHATIVLGGVGFFMIKLTFGISADRQEKSIRRMIREEE